MSEDFNPAEKFMNLKGKHYLEVKWRVVWLREDAPDSQIRSEHIVLTDQLAVFKATVTRIVDGEIKGVGEGYGSEQPKDFGDFIEKAETKAVGRALAALGYGTAAAFEESPQRIADSPVETRQQSQRPQLPPAAPTPRRGPEIAPETAQRPVAGPGQMTDAQAKKLWVVAKQAGLTEADLRQEVFEEYGHESIRDLTKKEASNLIDAYETSVQGPAQNAILDAETRPVGEPGNDQWSA